MTLCLLFRSRGPLAIKHNDVDGTAAAARVCVTLALNQRARMAMEERFVLMYSAALIFLTLVIGMNEGPAMAWSGAS